VAHICSSRYRSSHSIRFWLISKEARAWILKQGAWRLAKAQNLSLYTTNIIKDPHFKEIMLIMLQGINVFFIIICFIRLVKFSPFGDYILTGITNCSHLVSYYPAWQRFLWIFLSGLTRRKNETSARSCLIFCTVRASWRHLTPNGFEISRPHFWTGKHTTFQRFLFSFSSEEKI